TANEHRNGHLRHGHRNDARPGDEVVMRTLAALLSIRGAILARTGLCMSPAVAADEVVIDFEQVAIKLDPKNDEAVNRPERYVEKGVEFKLARQPERSKAR